LSPRPVDVTANPHRKWCICCSQNLFGMPLQGLPLLLFVCPTARLVPLAGVASGKNRRWRARVCDSASSTLRVVRRRQRIW
jgi:hypothetical protein